MEFLTNLYSQIYEVIKYGVFGFNIFEIFIIIVSFIFALLFRELFAKSVVKKIKKLVLKTNNKIDDSLLNSLLPPFKILPIVLVFSLITIIFDANSTLALYFQKINKTLVTIFVFWLFYQSLTPFSVLFNNLEKLLTKALILWIFKSLKYLIIFLGIVAVLEVWGIKIGPIIAGLGLFGVAVALGAQDLFKNLISGVMIILEKRFHIGDVISIPGHTEGTVEHIGFRSTLIRKFDTTPISMPNYLFAEAPILNFSNRTNRRINWIIGLEYSSTIGQIKKFTEQIETYIKESKDFTVNETYKSYIRIDKFNDSSIDILIYCFSSTNDWETFLEIKEKLAVEIKNKVEELGLVFAYPSQSIYIEKNI